MRNNLKQTIFQGISFSLKTKLFVIFALVIFITSAVISGVFYWRSSAFLKDKNNTLSSSLISQTVSSLNNLFAGVESTSRLFVSDDNLRQILRRSQDLNYPLAMQLEDYTKLSGILAEGYWDKNILAVQLYCGGNAIYAREQINLFDLHLIQDKAWYQKVCFLRGGPLWYAEEGTLTCALSIMDYYVADNVSGILKVKLQRQKIESILQEFLEFSKGEAALVDLEGNLIIELGVQPELLQTYLTHGGAHDFSVTRQDRANQRQVQKVSLENGWSLLVTISDEIFFSGRLQLLFSILLPVFLAIVAATVTIRFTLHTQTKRIEAMAAFLRVVQIGSEQYLEESGQDEITVLQSGLNHLLKTTRQSMQDTALAIRLKNEANYNILQEQINPHFLYNCLDSINWMAMERQVPEISKMVRQLGRFYRLSLHGGNKAVPLHSEIAHTAIYTEIMQIRFDGNIGIQFRLCPDAQNLFIPKLILQPLIENAIHHGISGRESTRGQIRIRTAIKKNCLWIRVTDNGVGMRHDVLLDLRANLYAKNGTMGYGMRNVHQRIQLTYGDGFGLSVHSYEQRGTVVVICMPCNP